MEPGREQSFCRANSCVSRPRLTSFALTGPDALPALYDPSSCRWIAGFQPITAFLGTVSPSYDVDAALTPSQKADTVAYASYITTHATPLIALSLYVSSANWVAATRPAYSRLLPFPLTWIEPLAVRSAMAARADHLGLSSLDADSADGASPEANDAGALFAIPERLRPRPRAAVSAALSPEDRATIRLEAAADACLAPLAAWLGAGEGHSFLAGPAPTSSDFLAYGHLALMLGPDVPRPWLRRVLHRKYPTLAAFVARIESAAFGGTSPAPAVAPSAAVAPLPARVAWGLAGAVPGLAEEWHRWAAGRGRAPGEKDDAQYDAGLNGDLVPVLRAAACLPLLAGAVLLVRRLPPWGSPLYQYARPKVGLGAFGSAGGVLGYLSVDTRGNTSGGGGGSSASPGRLAAGFEDVSIEIGPPAPGTWVGVDSPFDDRNDEV